MTAQEATEWLYAVEMWIFLSITTKDNINDENTHQNHTLVRKCCINSSKYGENTVHNDLIGVDIGAEIAYLIRNNKDLDERLVSLLKEVAIANESIDTVNLFVVKYLYGEVSQQDLLIAINKYKSSKQSVVD